MIHRDETTSAAGFAALVVVFLVFFLLGYGLA